MLGNRPPFELGVRMSLDQLVSSFKSGNLEIDCREMKLTQNRAANPITYAGKGTIRQAADGRLEFKLYATSTNDSQAADIKRIFSVASGQMYVESDYCTLTATAYDGEV